MHGTRNLPLSSVGSQKFTENNRTHAGGQPTLHPHPRVTAVAKTRNRRAACPLPQLSGRGIFRKSRLPYPASKRARDLINRSCPRSFDFVRVAHFAPKEKTAAFGKCSLCGGRRGFLLVFRVAAPPRDLLRMTVSVDRAAIAQSLLRATSNSGH